VTVSDAGLSIGVLVKAIEAGDAESQIPLYADDAEVLVVDPHHPPRAPMTLRGKRAVAYWIRDICSVNMSHQVVDLVDGGDRVAFTEEGRYRDGARVLSTSTLSIRGGLIAKQRVVLVWDDLD
jgi:ketosteroid isomerase-like protein